MTHKNDVEWLPLCDSTLESINGQASILRNLNSMAIFLEYLHGQLLVDQIILGQENVESNIIGSRNGADGVRFQCRDECRCQILGSYWRCYLGADTIVQTPFN